jgi:hypothetical protein
MAISLKDLLDHPELIEKLKLPMPKCIRCGSDELPHPDEEYFILGMPANREVCADCHYDAAGEWIEANLVSKEIYINN